MKKKILYTVISLFILGSLDSHAGPPVGNADGGGGIFEAVILFQNTPNPTADKTLIRTYLPDSDPAASIRILGTDSTTMVKEISIGGLVGISSTPLDVSDWKDGTYTYQLFYKGDVHGSHTLIVKH
jgi:hypothetical protein